MRVGGTIDIAAPRRGDEGVVGRQEGAAKGAEGGTGAEGREGRFVICRRRHGRSSGPMATRCQWPRTAIDAAAVAAVVAGWKGDDGVLELGSSQGQITLDIVVVVVVGGWQLRSLVGCAVELLRQQLRRRQKYTNALRGSNQ